MSLKLLMGPAGSGKTERLLKEFQVSLAAEGNIIENDCFFVLPSAEHTERIISLIIQRGSPGFFYRRVTTLSSLITEHFEVGSEGIATNVTRYLALKRILEETSFDYFKEVQNTPGFLNLILGFITELKDSMITKQVFRERMNALKTLEPDLASKYEAMASIYERYQEVLEAGGLRDRQDNFSIYKQMREDGLYRTKRIGKLWLDGFFDFSEIQYAYLNELCEMSNEVTLSLTYDPSEKRSHLFEAIDATAERLQQMGFVVEELKGKQIRLSGDASGQLLGVGPAALQHLSLNLFSEIPEKSRRKPTTAITLFEAIGMEGEMEMIARTIRHMVRKGDYRLSDFAILFRQIGQYEPMIRSIFKRYDIPVEIHERERLGFAPLMQAIAKLVMIYKEGWKSSDLLEFLKSTYVRKIGSEPKEYEWVSVLENKSKWYRVFQDREAWLRNWENASEFDQEKKKYLNVLATLEDELKKVGSFREFEKAFLEAIKTTFQLFEATDSLEVHAKRDIAAFQRLEAILGEIEASMSHTKKDAYAEGEIFEAFSDRFFRLLDLDLYSIRNRNKNQVQVYDISLARQKEYRVVFVSGLLEKKFPVQIKEDPILSDWERKLLNGGHSEGFLLERLPRQAIERYLFYLGVTRALDKLFLTYPHLDLEGKEALPSYYVAEVKRLFNADLPMRRQELSRPYPAFSEVVNERELEIALMGELWRPLQNEEEVKPSLLYLTNEILKRNASAERFKRAFYEPKAELTDEAIHESKLFHPEVTSPTRLEEYAKCPFKYYAHRILRLEDTEDDQNIRVRGTVLHDVLENLFRESKKDPNLLKDVERAKKKARSLLKEALVDNPILTGKRYEFALEMDDFVTTLERFIEAELKRLADTRFKPAHFEFDFGGKDGDAPALELKAEGGTVRVQGKVDRIDVDEDGKRALVVDYKRSAFFNKKDLEMGTALQLPLYTLAARAYLSLDPVGAELYSLRSIKKNGFYKDSAKAILPKSYSRRMMLSEKEFEAVLERGVAFIHRFMKALGEKQIRVMPRSCESFCPYSSVCRIEKWKLPMILEEIKEEDSNAS